MISECKYLNCSIFFFFVLFSIGIYVRRHMRIEKLHFHFYSTNTMKINFIFSLFNIFNVAIFFFLKLSMYHIHLYTINIFLAIAVLISTIIIPADYQNSFLNSIDDVLFVRDPDNDRIW